MSGWFWRMIALKATFVAVCLVSYIRADDVVRKLPFCNPHNSNEGSANNDLVIVSTLDGRLTAFSTQDGAKAWDLETLPLLSSNLHHVELTSGGKWVRLVPSLRGTLYSMSGDTIEPLPFNAEQLLSSSFKYSDDLVIAGARETLWLGLDSSTGSVMYECGSGGCSSEQQTAGEGREVLVLRRHSNTVRALDPRTGTEKWNFSVAEHQLAMSNSRECAGATSGPSTASLAIAIALPEGVVAVRHPDTLAPLWQQKLEAPVAGMWRLQDGLLQNIDVLWEATKSLGGDTVEPTSPSLYIGVHDRQLYIQEGQLYAQKLETSVSLQPVPWKLKHSRPLLAAGETALAPTKDPDKNTLSLITLYGNTGQTDNHGFFLYLQETCDQAVQVKEETYGGADILKPNDSNDDSQLHHIHVHIYSLWYWWKEVFVIAISSALLMNLMIWPRFFASRTPPPSPLPINQDYIVVKRNYDRSPPVNAVEYSGRYEKDFTPLRCLGRGGFGVVFEARNNIDHCSYAVKRITLPRRESKRERVLREVRALAKLEHEHIVRYFNAWLEEPPPYWQEQRDAVWMRELDGVSLDMTEDYDSTSMHYIKPAPKNSSVKLNMLKCDDGVEELSERSKRQRSYSCHDSFSVVFDDNAPSNPHLTISSSSNTLTKDSVSIGNVPNMLSREPASGDNDDSFIVFANTGDLSQGLSEARKEPTVDKRLEVVKGSENYTKTENSIHSKKKKGHRRHWSLDLCVRSTADEPAGGVCKMYLYIQMQLCLRDNLHHWLRQNRSCDKRNEKVRTLFSQIVSAVEYVHLAGLIHRDLKPSNIFFAPDGKVKIGDFGLVTTMSDNSQDEGTEDMNPQARHTYRVGTHLYMSPEQLEGRPYGYKVDIYSLGLILFELLQPFGTESERVACLLQVRKHIYPQSFQEEYPNEMELLKLMLSEDPSRRPTASGVRSRAPLYQQTDETWHFTLPSPSAAVG